MFRKKRPSHLQLPDSIDKLSTPAILSQRTPLSLQSPKSPPIIHRMKSFQITTHRKLPENSFAFDDLVKTPFDEEIMRFKHRSTANQHLRLESIYKFVYEKKLRGATKYNLNPKSHQQALPVPNGSISIMLNKQKKDQGFSISQFKKKIPPKSKFKMKWKTIQWILLNRKDAIDQIFSNYQKIIQKAKDKKEGMNKEEFSELLNSVQLGADRNLAEKLFYVFDEDQSGTVDYKELIVGLEVLKDDTIEEKLKIFFDLCDLDGSGKISEKEIFNVLKSNIVSESDKYQLRQSIKEMIKNCDSNGDGELDKQEILAAASNNAVLRRLLEQTISNVKRIDTIIQNDLEEPFHQFVPATAHFVQQKEGIHFPTQQKILDMIQEMESIHETAREYITPRNKHNSLQNSQFYQGLQETKNLDDSQN
ncbi:unnamed protein product [Paramecium octaurelia]|uniref:EF-hand domain-containing protein n=1 Tax=Paramecium octaurelia TaxID=43137 RepID=A0A8S1WCC9_PAROT|nr:unnamed protein product [Paramecium octaurelia]